MPRSTIKKKGGGDGRLRHGRSFIGAPAVFFTKRTKRQVDKKIIGLALRFKRSMPAHAGDVNSQQEGSVPKSAITEITVIFIPSEGGNPVCFPFPMRYSERDSQTLVSLRRVKEGTLIFASNRSKAPEDLALLYQKAGEHARGEHGKQADGCIGCGTRVAEMRPRILQAAGLMEAPVCRTKEYAVPAEMM